MLNTITDIEGIRVGHASDFESYTGCTVILLDKGAQSAGSTSGEMRRVPGR